MSDSGPITWIDKLKCVERELKFRQFVYPKWIGNGKMTTEKAAHELAVMAEIVADYKAKVDAEQAKGRLI